MALDQKSTLGKIAIAAAEHNGLVSVAVFLGVVLVGYLVLFAPALRQISAANRSTALESERAAKEQYLTELGNLDKEYNKIPADDIERIHAMIPLADDLPALLVTLEAIGQENDVAITSVNFSGGLGDKPKAGSGLVPINISMTLEHADYARFKLFLEAMEHHLRIFDIVSMSMNPSGAQYALTVRTYVHQPLTQ
jgi:Tfp pilus assembly protein PilO